MKGYIIKHFGSLAKCAEELGVTPVTVRNWVRQNPRGILKHAPEILRDKDTTSLELFSEVAHREYELTKAEDA